MFKPRKFIEINDGNNISLPTKVILRIIKYLILIPILIIIPLFTLSIIINYCCTFLQIDDPISRIIVGFVIGCIIGFIIPV